MNTRTNKSKLEEQIEENLKRVYQERVVEPVPDKFLDLIRQLKEQADTDAK